MMEDVNMEGPVYKVDVNVLHCIQVLTAEKVSIVLLFIDYTLYTTLY